MSMAYNCGAAIYKRRARRLRCREVGASLKPCISGAPSSPTLYPPTLTSNDGSSKSSMGSFDFVTSLIPSSYRSTTVCSALPVQSVLFCLILRSMWLQFIFLCSILPSSPADASRRPVRPFICSPPPEAPRSDHSPNAWFQQCLEVTCGPSIWLKSLSPTPWPKWTPSCSCRVFLLFAIPPRKM